MSETETTSRPCNSGVTFGNSEIPGGWSTRKQLYCKTRYNLAIDETGNVYGTKEPYSPNAILQFTSVAPTEVQMRGVNTGFYLAMDRKGNLYGEHNPKEEGTIFVESYDNNTGYNTYLSRKYAHMGWYVGIKKSGRPKPGPRAKFGQKAVMFLPRQAAPSGTE